MRARRFPSIAVTHPAGGKQRLIQAELPYRADIYQASTPRQRLFAVGRKFGSWLCDILHFRSYLPTCIKYQIAAWINLVHKKLGDCHHPLLRLDKAPLAIHLHSHHVCSSFVLMWFQPAKYPDFDHIACVVYLRDNTKPHQYSSHDLYLSSVYNE